MKNKIFNFILKSNQILFFLVAVGIIGITLLSLLPPDYSRPAVQIEKNIEQNNTKKIRTKPQYFKSFHAYIKDVFIIKVHADNITSKKVLHYSAPRLSSMNYYSDNEHALVNLIFTKEDEGNNKLLKNDAYIVSFNLVTDNKIKPNPYRDNNFKLEKNIYVIVSNDTNKDNFLSTKDQQDFYVSNYDGKQIKLVLKDILKYKVVEDNLVLITKKVNKKEHFYLFNVLTSNLKELDTTL